MMVGWLENVSLKRGYFSVSILNFGDVCYIYIYIYVYNLGPAKTL